MDLPQEIELYYVIPALRAEIAKIMLKLGLKQREIAEKLEITEAAVSQYIKGKRAKPINFSKEIKHEIKNAAINIAKDNSGLVSEFNRLCLLIRKNKTLCRVHQEYGSPPKHCCFKGDTTCKCT